MAIRMIIGLLTLWGLLTTATSQPFVTSAQEILRQTLHVAGGAVSHRVSGEPLQTFATVQRFYTQRAYDPAWSDDTGLSPQVDALLTALQGAEHEGLQPQDYHLERLKTLRQHILPQQDADEPHRDATLAELDLLLTDAFLAYASHLMTGRLDLKSMGMEGAIPAPEEDVVSLLQHALETSSIPATLQAQLPLQAGYVRLRDALAYYRALADSGGWPALATGRSLRIGDRSARVATLRTRLLITGELLQGSGGDDTLYDPALAEAVRTFQKRHGLRVDGIVGPNTVTALNVPAAVRAHQIAQNLERWRWLPRDLGERYILVNIPAYALEVREYEQPVLTMGVVVGKPDWPTPTFSAEMTYVVMNPSWNVPANIAKKELLPKIRRDPSYLTQHEMQVWRRASGQRTHQIDPFSVDWSQVSSEHLPYRFRQQPGPRNPLGDIKFMFPNRFDIYLHDTPSRRLFSRTARAFSHGCVRLAEPLKLAAYVLQGSSYEMPARLRSATTGRKTRTARLSESLPVHLVYRTAWVDEEGIAHFRADIYGHDMLQQDAAL